MWLLGQGREAEEVRVKRGWSVSSGELMHHRLGVVSNILLNDSKWLKEMKHPYYKEIIITRGSGYTALLFGYYTVYLSQGVTLHPENVYSYYEPSIKKLYILLDFITLIFLLNTLMDIFQLISQFLFP